MPAVTNGADETPATLTTPNFCAQCGTALAAGSLFCPNCGAPIDEGHLVCRYCGTDVRSVVDAPVLVSRLEMY